MKRALLFVTMCTCGLGLLLSGAELSVAQEGAAKPAPVLSTAGGVRDALLQIPQGQLVELTLANGKSYAGHLGTVGAHTLLVSKLSGKEYYDALVRIEDVSSIELRVR